MVNDSLDFDTLWQSACRETHPDPAGAAGDLMGALSLQLSVEQVQYEKLRNAAIFLVDLSTLGFTGMDINVFMISQPPRDPGDHAELTGMLREYAAVVRLHGLCFHVVLGPKPSLREQISLPELNVVCLYREDLARMFTHPLPLSILYDVSRNQLHLSNLCPYNTTKIARGSLFVGRRTELRLLTHQLDRSFVVSGARRIGKTSLLTRAYVEVERALSHANRREDPEIALSRKRVFFFNGLNWKGWRDCARAITHDLEPKKESRVDLNPRNLTAVIERQRRRRQGPLLFFFDEFDEVVLRDEAEGWRLFGALAEAIEAQHARIVIAGYREVSRLANVRSSPMHKKLDLLGLSALSPKETQALTSTVLQNLGVQVHRVNEFLQRLMLATDGFPFLVQFFGERLFERVEDDPGKSLSADDVAEIEGLGSTIDFTFNHYRENTRNGMEVQRLERLCCLLFARDHEGGANGSVVADHWDEQMFIQKIDRLGLDFEDDEVDEALGNLCNAAIFRNEGGRYVFAFPLLQSSLKVKLPDLNAAIERVARRVR